MAGTLITITDAGRAALVAPGNAGTNAHTVAKIGLSNVAFAAVGGLTKLPGELKRISTFAGENVAPDTIHVTLRDDTADQYTLYGFGLYLENDVLFAVYSQPAPIMEKSPQALLLLSADLLFATIDAAQLVFGDASFTNPPATTERQGVIELATQSETDAGTDDTRAVTPRTAAKRYAALSGADFAGPISAKNTSLGAGTRRANISSDATTAYYYSDGNAWLGSSGVEGMTGLVAGNREAARILPSGRVLVGTTDDDGSSVLQAGGSVRIDGNLSVRRSGEAQIYAGQNDGYFFANARQAGWYSPTLGQFQFDFAKKNLFVGNQPVWHGGNLNPLDKGTGGTIGGDVTFAAGKRLYLDEGSAAYPSLTFVNDGAPDTGFYHVIDGSFAIACNAVPTVTFSPSATTFHKPVTGPTPQAGDSSILLATTAWVTSSIASASIGQIVMEPRTTARAGFLKANGAVVNRVDYPALWAYAQASGALVADAAWGANNFGCFSSGDGAATFRLPELRGEFLRCLDDGRGVDPGRGIGTWQDSQNRAHVHGASADAVGDHAHGAWTDAQGWHGHHGNTAGVGDHQHVVPYGENVGFPWGVYAGGQQGSKGGLDGDNNWPYTSPSGSHAHSFDTEGAGNHGHNVGIGGAGNHSHTIRINADGGAETRVRSVALLAMIRAF